MLVLSRTNSRGEEDLTHLSTPEDIKIFRGYNQEKKTLTAADTIWAEIPFRRESRITDPWSERESGSFFFLRK